MMIEAALNWGSLDAGQADIYVVSQYTAQYFFPFAEAKFISYIFVEVSGHNRESS
jgi:hypothetical protein